MGEPLEWGGTGISRRKETGGSAPAAFPGTAGALGSVLATLPKSRPSVRSVHPQTTTPCVFPTFQRRNFPTDSKRSSPKMRLQPPTAIPQRESAESGKSRMNPRNGKREKGPCPALEFSPPVSSHGFMVLDHHGELGIGIQGDSLQIPLKSLEKRGGGGQDQLLEVENPNPKPPQNHSIPKAKFPSKSTGKLPWEKAFLGHGLPGRNKSQELLQHQICARFPTKFPFVVFGILAHGSTRTGLEGKRCGKNSHSMEISCNIHAELG